MTVGTDDQELSLLNACTAETQASSAFGENKRRCGDIIGTARHQGCFIPSNHHFHILVRYVACDCQHCPSFAPSPLFFLFLRVDTFSFASRTASYSRYLTSGHSFTTTIIPLSDRSEPRTASPRFSIGRPIALQTSQWLERTFSRRRRSRGVRRSQLATWLQAVRPKWTQCQLYLFTPSHPYTQPQRTMLSSMLRTNQI